MMCTRGQRKPQGLTLVELLVAITIVSVVITISLSVLFSARKVQLKFDEKYASENEADLVMKEIETSIRLAHGLVSGTCSTLVILDVNLDTCVYYKRADTLFKNHRHITDLPIDSLCFTYIKPEVPENICDFYAFDEDKDGILSGNELRAICGVNVGIYFWNSQRTNTVRRQFSVRLRNAELEY
jgi:prepilin-type N-terminal cleavage/methylation domain-containing protein